MRDVADGARITELLHKARAGDSSAEEELVPLVYDELRRLARYCMRKERPEHTLQTTGLVHEAYLKLMGPHKSAWQDRNHFFAVAAGVMRRILVDYARMRKAAKRGGGAVAISLSGGVPAASCESWDKILDLHRALSRLAEIDARAARVVELRFFTGLEIEEIAQVLELSGRTVKRDWEFAQSWLFAQIAESRREDSGNEKMSPSTSKSRI